MNFSKLVNDDDFLILNPDNYAPIELSDLKKEVELKI